MLATFVENQTQLPFDQAEKITGLPAELLRKLVRDGVIAGDAPWRTQKLTGSCDIEEACQIAAQLQQAHQLVEGQGISAYDAAENTASIQRASTIGKRADG